MQLLDKSHSDKNISATLANGASATIENIINKNKSSFLITHIFTFRLHMIFQQHWNEKYSKEKQNPVSWQITFSHVDYLWYFNNIEIKSIPKKNKNPVAWQMTLR